MAGPGGRRCRDGVGAAPLSCCVGLWGEGAWGCRAGSLLQHCPLQLSFPPLPHRGIVSLGSLLVAFREVKGCLEGPWRRRRVQRGLPLGVRVFCLLPFPGLGL